MTIMIRPKKDIKPIKIKNKIEGKELRESYSKEIVKDTPFLPKSLEYEDIDIAFKNFVENEIELLCDNKIVPTFTLYSNQRFSEYSQTWQHTDENNNLLMNFKTIVRDKNPKMGTNQGNLWNIPGEKRFTFLMREVIDDNGIECYEIHSMKQPYTVDLLYKVTFVTNKFENLNQFNQKLNNLFKSRQHYIRPNGHFIPMVLEDISDDTEYNIENRKFYIQSCDIKVMAYIINKDDFKVELKPKRVSLYFDENFKKNKTSVEIEENSISNNENNEYSLKEITLFVNFDELVTKTSFTIDTDVTITSVNLNNIRNYRVWVNKTPIYTEKGFKLKENDEVLIKINSIDDNIKSEIIFNGVSNEIVQKELSEDVKNENLQNEFINID